MSGPQLHDDDLDRVLRRELADDLPSGIEGDLRRVARLAWRRAAAEPRRARWQDWAGIPPVWRPALPQAALVVALAMLGAGAAMEAAPPPPAVVESFQGREAAALTARALRRARAMECVVDLVDEGGRRATVSIEWQATGGTRVRLGAGGGPAERSLRTRESRTSLLTPAAARRAALDTALEPVRACLSPAALGESLARGWRRVAGDAPRTELFFVAPGEGEPGLTVAIDAATRLPLRLDGTDRSGRTRSAVCRWP